jgi:ankyrin repeat protein
MKIQFRKFAEVIAVILIFASACAGCFLAPTKHSQHRAIHDFARDGNLTLVMQDLSTNASDLNLPDDAGLTPLHLATLHCHTNVVAFLLKDGAEVNRKANDDATPLHFAAQEGCIETINLLLADGAKINARDNQHRTPLSRAEEWHRNNAAELLRKRGGTE